MTYSSTISFDPVTGFLTGTISTGVTAPIPPLGDVVVSAFADGQNLNGPFAQCRSRSSGAWTLSTASLSAGSHTIGVNFDYGPVAATMTITTAGPGIDPGAGGEKTTLLVNNAPRS